MFETQNMEAGDLARPSEEINIAKLRSALDLCLEELPNLLELGNVRDVIGEDYDFHYHRPSIMSLATVASTQMPETLGYCLLQVKGDLHPVHILNEKFKENYNCMNDQTKI